MCEMRKCITNNNDNNGGVSLGFIAQTWELDAGLIGTRNVRDDNTRVVASGMTFGARQIQKCPSVICGLEASGKSASTDAFPRGERVANELFAYNIPETICSQHEDVTALQRHPSKVWLR